MKVTTRFAPSPTGFLHIGGVRTALFNYLFAKQNNGTFVLRIEDTDKERSKEEWTDSLMEDLSWLGLEHDLFFKQSDRLDIHIKALQNLIEKGFAYEAEESERGEGKVIRFKNPKTKITFSDLIRGKVEVETEDLGDFIIARNMQEPLYHLAVVVDDADMNITHVIRAEEHLSNTPRQILIQEALGFERPTYAHLPLVLAEDRSKLSKRKHGETVSLTYYRNLNYFPEALINAVALLGWNPGDDREILSLEELVKEFDLEKIQKGGAIFNVEKLDWVNSEHLKKLSEKEKTESVLNYLEKFKKQNWNIESLTANSISGITEVVTERIKKWSDIKNMIENGDLDFAFETPNLDPELIKWKKDEGVAQAIKHLDEAQNILNDLEEKDFNAKIVKEKIWSYAEDRGKGSVLWPLRYSLTGKEQSPDPFIVAQILGKKETQDRWKKAKKILETKN